MTTIVAVQNSKGFVFAADAQVTEGDRAYMHPRMTKITEVGEYVMAGAGTSRCCDVVLFGWEPPIYDGTEHYKFMVSKFIPELRKVHENAGISLKEDEEFCFLVGFDKRVFYICQYYSRSTNFQSKNSCSKKLSMKNRSSSTFLPFDATKNAFNLRHLEME
jgi:hypothetical protein